MQLSTYKSKRGLSLSGLAAKTGVSKSTLSRAINGKPISRTLAERIEMRTGRKVAASCLVFPRKVVR